MWYCAVDDGLSKWRVTVHVGELLDLYVGVLFTFV